MTRIHVKLLSEDGLIYMRKNSDFIATKVKENISNERIGTFFPLPLFTEKKFEINDFELIENPNSNNKEIDFQNSITLYENLKDLPRYILCDEKFWLRLSLDKFYKVSRTMIKINGKSTIENMWMHKQGVRRGLMFGVLSRCFFRIALSIDNSSEDKYHLSRWIINCPERFRNLSWRSFSSRNELVVGILKGEKKPLKNWSVLKI